jgi:hypothetical protein
MADEAKAKEELLAQLLAQTRSLRGQQFIKLAHHCKDPKNDIAHSTKHFSEEYRSRAEQTSRKSDPRTIDVLPRMIILFCNVIQRHQSTFEAYSNRYNAKVSISTIIAYALTLIYGLMLHIDLKLRRRPSTAAKSYSSVHWKDKFAKGLLNLPVPTEIEDILEDLLPVLLNDSLEFCATGAGFSFPHDFPDVIPIQIMAELHDTVANISARTPPKEIYHLFYHRIVCTVNNTNIRVGNYFGIGIQGTPLDHYLTYASKLYQVLNRLFQPTLFRTYQQTTALTPLHVKPITYASENDINFYDYVFSASPLNLIEQLTVLNSIAKEITNTSTFVKSTCKLGDILKRSSNGRILNHAYNEPQLPHATLTTITPNVSKKPDDFHDFEIIHENEFATAIGFLSRPAALGTATTSPNYILSHKCLDAQPCQSEAIKVKTDNPNLARIAKITQPDIPDIESYLQFDPQFHVYPKHYILNVTGEEPNAAKRSALFGLIIESGSFDGTIIHQPNTLETLNVTNTSTCESAVHISMITPRYHYYDSSSPIQIKARKINRIQNEWPISLFFRDSTTLELHTLSTHENWCPATKPLHYGFTRLQQKFYSPSNQFFIATHPDKDNKQINSGDAVELRSQYLISPYRIVHDKKMLDAPKSDQTDIYMLSNLRTYFGTDFETFSATNWLESLPVN